MSLLRNITSGLRSLFRKERVDRELDEELGAYLEMAAAEKMREGMSRTEAVRAVRLEQGSLEVTKEVVRSGGWNPLWRRAGRICAISTTSGFSASALGRTDGGLTRDEALAHERMIVEATDLPVSADLERGFGDEPEVVAETIRLAAEVGLVGCTIEDATGNQDAPLYDVHLAVERIAAAAQAARALQCPFILTARAHNFVHAAPSLNDTISRLQPFEKAGADVLFAPGLPDLAAVRAVCAVVSKPVNFMAGIKGKSFSVGELAATGVRHISLATSLYRAAMTGLLDAACE